MLEWIGDLHWAVCSTGIVSCVVLTAVVLLGRWRARRAEGALGAGGVDLASRSATELPPISILKPFDGVDPGMEESFWSYVCAPYPAARELLFCTDLCNDAGIAVVDRVRERLEAEQAVGRLRDVELRLLLPEPGDPPRRTRKIWHLERGFRASRHAVVVNGDSGTRVPGTALADLVRTLLADPRRGASWAPYLCDGEPSLGVRLTRMSWHATPLSLPVLGPLWDAVGAGPLLAGGLFALRREVAEGLDGFAVADGYVTEDLILGQRIGKLGWKIAASPTPLLRWLGKQSTRQVWDRQVRWSVGMWNHNWFAMLGVPLVMGGLALLPFTWAAAVAAFPGRALEYGALGGLFVSMRMAFAIWVLTRRNRQPLSWELLLMPLVDAVYVGAWAVAPFRRRMQWRGTALELRAGGQATPLDGRLTT
jgi:cellulose synthase/poly-beta-1,6-N-acetylglucosamine synthase-like glycosyltransferase